VYDNPNKIQEAKDKLFNLRQGSESIPLYIAKFKRLLYEAKGQDWPDLNKISTFRNGLSSTVRNRLTQQLTLPREYSKFIRVVQKLAGSSRPAPSFTSPPVQARGDTIDLSALELEFPDKQQRKQMARRIPALNQDELDINTLNVYGLDGLYVNKSFVPQFLLIIFFKP
jgi:hypothetical protein